MILTPAIAVAWVDSTLFAPKLFIENKGQFDNPPYLSSMQNILFAVNHNKTKIFFSNNRIAYTLFKTVKDEKAFKEFQRQEAKGGAESQKELEEEQDLKNRIYKTKTAVIYMDWLEANPNCKIEASGMADEYFNYGMDKDIQHDINFVKGYKRITYKNIYEGIDIEYTFHEKTGIKYNIFVHPGADISKVKLKYSGTPTIFLDEESNVIIKTPLGNIIDHAPFSLSEKNGLTIKTKFVLKNNVLSFQVDEYDRSQSLLIDPWISSTLPELDTAYEIAVDPAGNVLVYGDYNSQVKKYDNTGAPQWTFISAPGWLNSYNKIGGDITVDPAGSSYMSGQGDIRKLSAAGTSLWLLGVPIDITTMGCQELGWRMVYDPANNKLYGAGSNGQTKATTYDPATGIADWNYGDPCKIIQGPCPSACPNSNGEIRHLTLAPNGNFYAYTAQGDGGQTVSTITGFDTALTGIYRSCNVPNSPYWVGGTYYNGWYYMANGIAASNCFIYIYSGSEVEKFDIFDPSLLGSATIANGSLLMNSGILADQSNNFYVGTQTGISAYSSSFSLITSVTTSNPVYDMAFAPGNNIAACGKGFVGVYANIVQVGAPITCSPSPNLPMTATADTLLSTVCGSNNSLAWVDTIMYGVGPYSYSWDNGATTDTISNLAPGNYSCTIIDVSCPPETTAVFVTIPSSSSPAVTTTSTNALCGASNGSATATVTGGTTPYNFSWNPSGQTSQTAINLSADSYTVTVTDAHGCMALDTIEVTTDSMIIAAGPDTTICSGQSLTIISSGGANYLWSSGQTTASITVAPTDTTTYSVIVSVGGCIDTAYVTITVIPLPAVTVSGNTTLCTGDSTTLTASGGTDYSWSNGTTTAIINVSPVTTETYTVTASIGSCMDTTSVTVLVAPVPVASVTGAVICSGQSATLTATGGGNYLWSNGTTNSSITVSPLLTTIYTVIVSVGSCPDTANAIITVNPTPIVALGNNQTICNGQNVTLDAGNPSASYLWSTGETSQTINVSVAGTYWVIIALNNCLAKDTVETFLVPKIHLSDSSLCTTSPILLNPGSGASGYLWSTGSTSQSISVDVAGSYWVQAIFGNCMSGDTSKITGDGTGGLLFIPNSFTPDNDNLNEIFLAKGTGIESFKMLIFDRWGNLIFESDDVNKGWNGKVQGGHYPLQGDGIEVAQEDVYVWKIEYTTQCFPDQVKKAMGHVSIVK